MKALYEIEWDGASSTLDPETLHDVLTGKMYLASGRGEGYDGLHVRAVDDLRVRAVDDGRSTVPAGEKAFVDDLAPPKPDVQVSAQPEAAPWPYTDASEFIRWLSMLPNFDSKTLHIEVGVKQ